MNTRFKNLKNDLEGLESDPNEELRGGSPKSGGNSGVANYILLFAFVATLLFYFGSKIDFDFFDDNPITELSERLSEYDPDLLDRMGAWLVEMGYPEMNHEQLTELRDRGLTATYVNEIREAGFSDISLDDAVELRRAGVSDDLIQGLIDVGYTNLTPEQAILMENEDASATFARMMNVLGYTLSIEDLAEMRRNGVTAYFTSNMYDLGYTKEDLSKENLIRMRDLGVSHELAQALIEQEGRRLTVEELIRYKISNQ
ncbi:MAG: hypothetical protein AAFW89_06885 [Bacteroidota bacterium]